MGGTERGQAKAPTITAPKERIEVGGGAAVARAAAERRGTKRAFESGAATEGMKGFKTPREVETRTKAEIKKSEDLKKTVTPFSALEKGGQSKLMQQRLNRFSKAGSGSGNFSISSTTRAQESRLGSKGEAFGGSARGSQKASPFSQKGMESFFGNMENLANKILSPEYQKQVASARTAATTRKGKLADSKAKTERMKAYGSMIKDLSESGGNESVIKMLENKITTEGAEEDIDPMAKFASQLSEMGLPREQISQIAGIIEGGAKR
jgi:hypothetical protein